MTYIEFIEQVEQKAHKEFGYSLDHIKFYPAGYTSDDPEVMEWIKDSNRCFEGREDTKLLTDFLVIDVPISGGNGAPGSMMGRQRIAMRDLYRVAEEQGFEEAFKRIRAIHEELEEAQADMKKVPVDIARLDARAEYGKVRSQLIVRPLNYRSHIRDLQGCVYRKVGEVALVLYQVLGDANGTLLTSRIRREELKRWGMEDKEGTVLLEALKNTARLYPPCVYDQRTGQEENFLEKEFSKKDITMKALNTPIIILSTFKTTNGAVSLFYPGVIEKMMKIMGGPFLAVFMNTNDVLIFKMNDPMAGRFAKTAKKEKNMLSGMIYRCDKDGVYPGTMIEVPT